MIVRLKKLNEDAVLPDKAYESAAGYDLYSAEEKRIAPGEYVGIGTGWAIQLPPDTEAQIRPRSGLAVKHGITVLNSPGTIDPDYRGEIRVILINHGSETFSVEKGTRIAQLVIARLCESEFEIAADLSVTERDKRGFGSSGL